MKRAVAIAPEETFYVVSDLPPSRTQKRLALAVVLFTSVIALVVMGPLSGVRLRPVAAFLPMYLMAMFVIDSLTAVLLFAQFAISRSPAMHVLASGYVFTAITVIPYSLTFPGVFAPESVIGDLQSTAWLFDLWHVGFPMFVIGYVLLKDKAPTEQTRRLTVPAAIVLSLVSTAAVVFAAVVLCILVEGHSPIIILDTRHFSPLFPYFVGVPVVTASLCALAVLWIRQRSMLDLWLMVVLFLFVIEMPISYFPDPARFSLGWYTARVIGFLNSGILLIVLLYEITTLYARLLHAIRAQHREREARLLTGDAVAASIAHEVKQPLTGMMTSADAALRFLNRATPDLNETKEALKQVIAAGQRASAVIGSIRNIFKNEARHRTSLDLNELIRDTLALVRENLTKHRVIIETDLNDHLSKVTGDRIQLQQVLVNLISNAIDSMAGVDGSRVLTVRSGRRDDGDVGASIADTGIGISPEDMERIFNPLFTTKLDGMGMGLSICRSIIESHDGRLWAAPNAPRGAVFYFSFRPISL